MLTFQTPINHHVVLCMPDCHGPTLWVSAWSFRKLQWSPIRPLSHIPDSPSPLPLIFIILTRCHYPPRFMASLLCAKLGLCLSTALRKAARAAGTSLLTQDLCAPCTKHAAVQECRRRMSLPDNGGGSYGDGNERGDTVYSPVNRR